MEFLPFFRMVPEDKSHYPKSWDWVGVALRLTPSLTTELTLVPLSFQNCEKRPHSQRPLKNQRTGGQWGEANVSQCFTKRKSRFASHRPVSIACVKTNESCFFFKASSTSEGDVEQVSCDVWVGEQRVVSPSAVGSGKPHLGSRWALTGSSEENTSGPCRWLASDSDRGAWLGQLPH
jgi:hypothetical protein